MPFSGFLPGKTHLTPIPATFFSELLPEIDTLAELKIVLYAFWFLDHQESAIRFICYPDFVNDKKLMHSLHKDDELAQKALEEALERATLRGIFIRALSPDAGAAETIFFLNSERGRAAAQSLEEGKWHPDYSTHVQAELKVERPNIFRLYEENIGPINPIMVDTLQDAEATYPPDWIEDAIHIAVENNARSWRYIQAVLRAWQERGRNETNKRDSEDNRYRYIQGDYAEFIDH